MVNVYSKALKCYLRTQLYPFKARHIVLFFSVSDELTAFMLWLESLDGGEKNIRRSRQMASQVDKVILALVNKHQGMWFWQGKTASV